MTHQEESAANPRPAIEAAAKDRIAARFTDSAGAKPDAVKRTDLRDCHLYRECHLNNHLNNSLQFEVTNLQRAPRVLAQACSYYPLRR